MGTVNSKEEIISLTKSALYYTKLLIKQLDSWLPEEEGIKNAEKRILKRKRKI